MPLSIGRHVIEWTTERLIENPDMTPLEIVSITVEGDAGISDNCVSCPIVIRVTN